MIQHFHLVSCIRSGKGSYTLRCRCSVDQYAELSAIICEGAESIECRITLVQQDEEVVEYQVVLPELPGDRYIFYALLKDGVKKGVWKPDAGLAPASLPAGFFFQGIYLNLIYEKGRSISKVSSDLNNYSAGFSAIWRNKSELFFSGYVFLPADHCDVNSVRLKIIKFRDEGVYSYHHVSATPAEENILGIYDPGLYPEYGGGVVYRIKCTVDMDIAQSSYGYFNLFIEHNGVAVTPSNYIKKLSERDHCFPVRLSALKRALFVPFHNEFFNRWRLDIYHLNLFEWFKLKRLKKRCLKKAIEKDRKTWLIGEYNSTARDNGMHFYNYICRKKTGIKAYYVIYRDAKQRHSLVGKNVVFYGSYKHFKVAAQAGVLVFSHMPEFLLPKSNLIVHYRKRMAEFKTIFIQHGVIAMKSNIMFYAKGIRNFDRFVVSSDFEKKIVHKHFLYDEDNIVVTGLPRWDSLSDKGESSRDILIAPTWRNELEKVDDRTFAQSVFFEFWNGILTSEPLLSFVTQHNITIRFVLHIGMHRFSHLFAESDRVIVEDGARIGELIKSSSMMVTDFSSVAFDMLFQDKPVVFCPYDLSGMGAGSQQRFIDFDKDIPGPICFKVDSAIQEIMDHVNTDFSIKDEYLETRNKYFKYLDSKNCDRLYNEIIKALDIQ